MGLPASPPLLEPGNLLAPFRRAAAGDPDPDLQGPGRHVRHGLAAALPAGGGAALPGERRDAVPVRAAARRRVAGPGDDPAHPLPRALVGRSPLPVPDGALRVRRLRDRRFAHARAARSCGGPDGHGAAARLPVLLRPRHPIRRGGHGRARLRTGSLAARLRGRGADRDLAAVVRRLGPQRAHVHLPQQLRALAQLHIRRPVREPRHLGRARHRLLRREPARLGAPAARARAVPRRLAPVRVRGGLLPGCSARPSCCSGSGS